MVAVVVVLLVSGGDDGDKKASASTSTTGTSTTAAVPESQINLRAAHKGSKALGIAQIVRQNGTRAMAIVGQDVPATTDNSFYAVWLYNSLSDAVRLGFTPSVGSDGKLQTLVPSLPANASRFKELLITRETTNDPKKPGTFVLRGNLALSG